MRAIFRTLLACMAFAALLVAWEWWLPGNLTTSVTIQIQNQEIGDALWTYVDAHHVDGLEAAVGERLPVVLLRCRGLEAEQVLSMCGTNYTGRLVISVKSETPPQAKYELSFDGGLLTEVAKREIRIGEEALPSEGSEVP